MAYKTDIEIAQSCEMRPIGEIAAKAHLDEKYVEQYGKYKAKIDLSLLSETKREDGKLILVTAITPTPAGEGKTTTTIGLADGLAKIGKDVKIGESTVTENCVLKGCSLWYSVLFSGVEVEEGTTLNSAVVMENTKIGKNCTIKYAIIAPDAIIEDGAIIGAEPENYEGEWGIAVVGSGAVVKAGQTVLPKEMIKPNTVKEAE